MRLMAIPQPAAQAHHDHGWTVLVLLGWLLPESQRPGWLSSSPILTWFSAGSSRCRLRFLVAPFQFTTRLGMDVDDPESFRGSDSGCVESLLAQPAGERVCAEVFPDDEVCDSFVAQARQPRCQYFV